MKINKQTMAYVLIGAGILAAVYYAFRKMKDKAAAAAIGAGVADTRGAFAADDDATYTSLRNAVKAFNGGYNGSEALGWIDPLVEESYAAGPAFHNIKGLNGPRSKAGSFLSVFEAVNPNPSGTFMEEGQRVLFPPTLHHTLWLKFNELKVKHGGLV